MSKSNYKYGAVSQTDDIEANNLIKPDTSAKVGFRNFHWCRIIGLVTAVGFVWLLANSSNANSPVLDKGANGFMAASVKNTYSVVRNGSSFKIVQPAVLASSNRRLNPDYAIASAEYIKNVDGNGWHYFSATAPTIETTVQFVGSSIVEDILDDHFQANLVIDEYLGMYFYYY